MTSPEPKEVLPVCNGCGEQILNIRYLDYENIRVVMHDGPNCVIGTINL